MKLLVFDIGGTEIKYSIMDETLSMEHSGHVPTPIDSFESFSKIICDIYQEYKEEVEGIAMSILGFVDSKNGVIKGGGLLRYNWQRPLRDELSRLCGCKVVMENDGKAAVKAEYRKGSLIGTKNAAVFVGFCYIAGCPYLNVEPPSCLDLNPAWSYAHRFSVYGNDGSLDVRVHFDISRA